MPFRQPQTEFRPGRASFDLPPRSLGPLRFFGLLPMGFAVLFAWMPLTQLLRLLERALSGTGGGGEWFFIAFLSLFVLAALMPFGVGLFILAGRTRITVTHDQFISTELAGPFRWSRRARLADLERLELGAADPAAAAPAAVQRVGAGLVACLKGGKKFPVAIGYPRAVLAPVLEQIRATLTDQGQAVPTEEKLVTHPDNAAPLVTPPQQTQPADSNVTVTELGGAVELLVPSRGLWKESCGLIGFGIVWSAVVGIILFIILFAERKGGFPIGPVLGVLAFDLIGVAALLVGIHMGTRRWRLRADPGELRVALQSALRQRAWQWPAADIESVGVGDSGTRVNNRRLQQLQIKTRGGGRVTGLLTGRDADELAWLATTLRRALGPGQAGADEAPPRVDGARGQG